MTAINYLTITHLHDQQTNHTHAWTANSVNRLVKKSKHITAITSPFKPDFTICMTSN